MITSGRMFSQAGITLVGLGPGDPSLLTRQAWDILNNIPEVYLRTRQHPTVAGFPPSLMVHSFDHYYEHSDSFSGVYEQIISRVIELGKRPDGVVYAVPGHPFVAEATCPAIARLAKEQGIPLQVVDGVSFLEAVFSALEIDPFPNTVLVDALELVGNHYPPFPPNQPVLIAQIHSPEIASEVKLLLMEVFPDTFPVMLVHSAGSQYMRVEDIPLYAIDRSLAIGLLTTLYLPPLDKYSSFESFQDIVAHLRSPQGCPWDREQTHQSLRPNLLEETYEVLAALDEGNTRDLCEELGDLLLQIVLHVQIANEYGEFNMAEVLKGIHNKLVYRHPHVFGEIKVADQYEVIHNWEKLKEAERSKEKEHQEGILDGIAQALPALEQAQAYQKRVARVGFDWKNLAGVMDKVLEELQEVKSAKTQEQNSKEIGDLLFAVVNLVRWHDVDAESALRIANARFRQRFSYIEACARRQGRKLSELSFDEMDKLWNEAKNI